MEQFLVVLHRYIETGAPVAGTPEDDGGGHAAHQVLPHQAPDPVPCHCHADAEHPADGGGRQRAARQALECQVALQDRQLRGAQRVDDIAQREPAQHRSQPRLMEEPCYEWRGQDVPDCQQPAGQDADPEGRVQVLAIQVAALDDRCAESLVEEYLHKIGEDRSQRHQPEGLRCQQAGKNNKDQPCDGCPPPFLDGGPHEALGCFLFKFHKWILGVPSSRNSRGAVLTKRFAGTDRAAVCTPHTA